MSAFREFMSIVSEHGWVSFWIFIGFWIVVSLIFDGIKGLFCH